MADKIRPKCHVLYFPVDFPDPSPISKITTSNSNECNSAVPSPCSLHCENVKVIAKAGKCSNLDENLSQLPVRADIDNSRQCDRNVAGLHGPCRVDPEQQCETSVESHKTCGSSNMSVFKDMHEVSLQSSVNNTECSPYPSAKQTTCVTVNAVEPSTLSRCDNEHACLCTQRDETVEPLMEDTHVDTDGRAKNICSSREDQRADEMAGFHSPHFHPRSNDHPHCQKELKKCTGDEPETRPDHQNGKIGKECGRHWHGGEKSPEKNCSGTVPPPFSDHNCMKGCGCRVPDGSHSKISPLHILWPHRW